jgi:Tfp pilus assembly protein PilO
MKNLAWLRYARDRKKLLDYAGAVIAILIVSAGFLIARNLQAEASTLQMANNAGIELFEKADILQSTRDELENTVQALRSDVESLRQRLPDSPDETLFLRQISELAAQSAVMINDYRPGAETKLEKHSEKEITFSCAGTYQGICHLLANLEKLPRVAHVYNLTVSAPNEANGNCGVEIRIRLVYGVGIEKSETTKSKS